MAEVSQSSGGNPMRGKIRSKKSSTRIDMTPMVDLAFLLLTFFMLTTSFRAPYVLEIEKHDKPGPSTPQPLIKDEKVITLILGEKNKIYWYQGTRHPKVRLTSFSSSGIRKILFEKKAEIQGLYIFIKPSGKSRYKNMVDILDELLITDIGRYSLTKVTAEDDKLIAESNL